MKASARPKTTTIGYTAFVHTLSVAGNAVDIVGDVHGCMGELCDLLTDAGYIISSFREDDDLPIFLMHPEGRKLVFAGDLTDRGPASDQVLRLVMGSCSLGNALCVMGNHDWKLYRHLCGRKVVIANGLASTLAQILPYGLSFEGRIRRFFESVPHQIRMELEKDHPYPGAQNLWIAHAAAKRHRQGLSDKESFNTSIYGYPLENTDVGGRPVRMDWAQEYYAKDPVIHGHTPYKTPRILNNVLCIDTGCVFGGALTLYRADTASFLARQATADHSGLSRTLE